MTMVGMSLHLLATHHRQASRHQALHPLQAFHQLPLQACLLLDLLHQAYHLLGHLDLSMLLHSMISKLNNLVIYSFKLVKKS